MKTSRHYSDEFLNAYLDGELDDQEKLHLIEELRYNQEVSKRVCVLQKTRSMVQLAYENVPQPEHQREQRSAGLRNRLNLTIAASLLLLAGAASGWLAHLQLAPGNRLLELAQSSQDILQDGSRIMLHVTTTDPRRVTIVLDETEALLRQAAASAEPLEIEVLANGEGLDFLRTDTSQVAQRIQQLQQRYTNLSFLACSQTIAQLKLQKGIEVSLLPQTRIIPSALGEVIRRQRQGWTYIKI